MPPLAMRAWCGAFRYCPNPLGIVPADQFDKLQFVIKIYTLIIPIQTYVVPTMLGSLGLSAIVLDVGR